MTYEVTWEPHAVDAASRYLDDDPTGLRALIDLLDGLAAEPRPQGSFPFGTDDVRRIRAGRYRALFTIDDVAREVVVTHIGRSA